MITAGTSGVRRKAGRGQLMVRHGSERIAAAGAPGWKLLNTRHDRRLCVRALVRALAAAVGNSSGAIRVVRHLV